MSFILLLLSMNLFGFDQTNLNNNIKEVKSIANITFDKESERKRWSEHYKSENKIPDPTKFAEFIVKDTEYLKKGDKVLDIGCGAGRDVKYFIENGYDAFGIDSSIDAISIAQSDIDPNKFFLFDIEKDITVVIGKFSTFNVFSRFFLNFISEEIEWYFLRYILSLEKDLHIFLEYKTTKNNSIKDDDDEKYLRLINHQTLKDRLNFIGFQILFSVEKNDISGTEENPIVGRVIAKKFPCFSERSIYIDLGNLPSYLPDEDRNEFNKKTYKLMNDINSLCSFENIPYFVFGGTLLGAIRHGGLIPWDDNLDVIVMDTWKDQFNCNAVESLLLMGYNVCDYPDSRFTGLKISTYAKFQNGWKEVFCNLLFAKEKFRTVKGKKCGKQCKKEEPCSHKYFVWTSYPCDKVFTFKENEVFPLKKACFGENFVNIPNMYLFFLERKFGKMWTTMAVKNNNQFTQNKGKPKSQAMSALDYYPANLK